MSRAFRAYKFVLLCGEAATDLHAGYYTLVEVRIRSILHSHSARWQWSFVFPNALPDLACNRGPVETDIS